LEIKVGTCGWSLKRSDYFNNFSCIEIQETFYKMPKFETLKNWRDESPKDFEFTIKAWQAITHPLNSPTWRKGEFPKFGKPENFGLLKPTDENIKAWNEIIKTCEILNARILIIQTPPSFTPSNDNINNIYEFFSSIDRKNLTIGWEPRGEWSNEIIAKICKELSLIHVVDPFRRLPSIESDITYFRLHGIGGKETNYRYVYTDEDLHKLYNIIKELKSEKIYVMFNNIKMAQDAMRFIRLLKLQ
jgi:uncharacterized protein YecE (DUF72 family)